MLRIDAHQHFWKYDPARDLWITNEMAVIQRDFLPGDLAGLLKANRIDGTIIVQSDQSEEENDFQLKNAQENDFVKGVVGWVDLQEGLVEKRLERYCQFPLMKGFRHVLQGEADRAMMLKTDFKRGISLLGKFGFTYDILIFPDQLKYAAELVREFPNQQFVIDHLAKPPIREAGIEAWKKDIRLFSGMEHVYCKISGMVTEADWKSWKKEDFHPYLDTVLECFGTKRILFGSDWPVCLLAASYGEVIGITDQYFGSFTQNEKELFYGSNAVQFYNL